MPRLKIQFRGLFENYLYRYLDVLYLRCKINENYLKTRYFMKHVVDMAWTDKVAFETDINGHKLIVDANVESGGSDLGPPPKRLMLTALAGCTGIDVIMILKKMKVVPEAFNVIVEADVTDEHPKHYNKMKVIYQFKGKDLPLDKLEKAVKLSETTYCGVTAVYRKAMEMETEIRIID